jgi:hypothetical protein
MQAFTWGDGGAAVTPDALAERRKLARVLMAQGSDTSPVQHWTQGAARIAQSLLGTYDMGQADKAERGARDASSERSKALLGALIGGDAPQPSMASIPVSAEAPSPSGGGIGAGGIRSPGIASAFPRSLIQSESGGNWQAQNNVTGAGGMPGHFGRLQFGQARLQDAMNAGAIPQGTTPQIFMADPGLQQQAEAWHFSDIDQNIKNSGLDRAIGATIKGIPVTQDGMRAVAHLGGSGGLAKFIQTGGQYDPADANGTRLSDYLKAHAGQTASPQAQPVQMAQAQQPNASQIQGAMEIINDPWAKPGDKAAAQFILQKRLTAETKDPVRSALEQEQLTAARNQNEQAPLARQEKQLSIQKSQRELDGTLPRAPTANMQEVDAENKARAAKGLPPMSVLDYSLAKAKASATNINMGGGTDKQVFDTMDESAKDAKSAVMGLQAIRDARASLQGGGVFGAGADAALQLRKIGAALGITGDDNLAKITNTETFRSAIAPQVASILKATVGSANISNSDREFAEKAAGGAISLDQTSIAKLLDIMERGNMARIQSHQERLNDIYPEQEDGRFKRERALFRAPMPKFMEQGPSVLEGMSPAAPQSAAPTQQPDRAALEAEARRRGLMK